MIQPRWLNESEARAWRGYRRMRLLLDAQVARDMLRKSGLSEPDYDVLSNLSESEGHRRRLSKLAAHMLWSNSRLSHHLTRMEQRGLVRREDDPTDARGAFVVLTKNGLRAVREAAPPHVESVRRHFIDLLSQGQIEALGDLTEKVLEHLVGNGVERPPSLGEAGLVPTSEGGDVASKDKGGKSEKKQPQKNLKEKRAAKKGKKGK